MQHAPTLVRGRALANPAVTSVTAFFPCYNDATTIAFMVRGALHAIDESGADGRVVVIDDGSTDASARVLADLAAAEPRLRVVTHEHNRGYGGALLSGFAAVEDQWVFYTDGDAQYDPRQLARLIAHAGDDVDVVQGYKLRRADGALRTVVGRMYHAVVRRAFAIEVRDTDCDFRLIRTSALARVQLAQTSGAICVELVRKLQDVGARFVEVGVDHYARPTGRSEFFRVRTIGRTLAALVSLHRELARR
jgi:glycosyltransferase involved in cell wall biosynthesis